MSWMKKCRVLFVFAVLLLTVGCAQERDPINRVQANALAKSFFVGEDLVSDADNPDFYANGTLLEVGYGAKQSGMFSGFYSNQLSIIRWEVQEDFLIGRLAYERIEGTDGFGAGDLTNDGQILYGFKITKHFDIRRAYNSSTGEELNVIEENTSDRVWHEREYFRVDWSSNYLTSAYDFDKLALYGFSAGTTWEPISYYVNDPAHEHAPRFETEDGYFDITTKAFATPAELDISHLGWSIDTYPACRLSNAIDGGTKPAGNCNPVEVTIRHSFWERPDNDYQPQHWDGYRFQAAGAFTKERRGYARDYGMSDSQWYRFISRYNVYQRSHYYKNPDAMTGPIECYTTPGEWDGFADFEPEDGTDDRCQLAGPGSRCDIFKQRCTLPYAERKVRPIVWYFTNSSDFTYFDPSAAAGRQWEIAMKLALQSAKHAECVRVGRADCAEAFPVIHGQMTMMKDLYDIEEEVDSCRRRNKSWDIGPCEDVVIKEIAERGYDAAGEDGLAMHTMAMMDDVVVLCHSPVMADDHPECAPGKPRLPAGITSTMCQEAQKDTGDPDIINACRLAYTVRTGDVRHHLINVIPTPQSPSPWGFGPTYADPLTGEGISASINVWANPTTRIARATVDQARFIAGELSPQQITNGEYIEAYVAAVRNSADRSGMLPHMTRAEVDRRLEETLKAYGRDLKTGTSPQVGSYKRRQEFTDVDPEVIAGHEEIKDLPYVRSHVSEASVFADKYANRLAAARGSAMEAELMSDRHIKELAGGTTHESLPTSVVTEIASPLRAMSNPTIQRELIQRREIALAERGACSLEAGDFAPSPSAMVGLTNLLEQKFGLFNPLDPPDVQLARAAKMQEYLAYKLHYSVIIHEMGHTFGLRHNFVSSSNAYFYRPQYWQLRTKDGTVTTECTDLATGDDAGADCVGPRYFDPLTADEQDNMIGTWAQSSTMDYAGDYTQDLIGLGAYDFHAARMFYGESATVFEDPKFNKDSVLSLALHDTIMDTFGGIRGLKYKNGPRDFPSGSTNIHYSQLQRDYGMIQNCAPIPDLEVFRPTDWDTELLGEWNPLIDGELVQVNGQYTRCYQQRVDYVPWASLRQETDDTEGPSEQPTGRIGPTIDRNQRTRVPYGFATDNWADTGNLSVYRHDVGADAYELFEFFITEQELRHIFDDFRRGISTFSVRSAAYRSLRRYNEKMRDGAKGIVLIKNNLKDYALRKGWIPPSLLQLYISYWDMDENLLASGMAFDHFARQLQRPNSGAHEDTRDGGEPLTIALRSNESSGEDIVIPEGPQGYWQNVSFGGKRTYNDLSDDQGEYDRDYTQNAGSYYDKLFVPYLLAESADNFISSSLNAFVDPRYRATSMADLFPDGYRRLLANNLTNEAWLKGPRVAAKIQGNVLTTEGGFPAEGIGWISWWTETPELCFTNSGTNVCTGYDENGTPFKASTPEFTRPIAPQVGWEQQKWLIAMTLAYIPENQKEQWLNMMGIWSLGADSDPGFNNRIELHLPAGEVYIARTYGTEEICFEVCKTVQRGIGARILEYAGELVAAAYVTTAVSPNGVTWYVPVLNDDGDPIVRYDSGLKWLTPDGQSTSPPADCSPDPNSSDSDYSSFAGCKCEHNAACLALEDYISIPTFMRQSMKDLQIAPASMQGLY